MALVGENKRSYDLARMCYEHYIARREASPREDGLLDNPSVIELWPGLAARKNNVRLFVTQKSIGKKNIEAHIKLLRIYEGSRTTR